MNTKKIVFTGIFIALVFVTTWIAKIPISIGWGYVHFGDLSVMLSGMLLGPVAGGIAGAFGSALADYAGGFVIYMIPTFIIKGILAFTVGFIYRNLAGKLRKTTRRQMIYHTVVAILIVVGGYFLSDLILAQIALVDLEGGTIMAYAAYGLPFNLIQVTFGIVTSMAFYKALRLPFENIYYN